MTTLSRWAVFMREMSCSACLVETVRTLCVVGTRLATLDLEEVVELDEVEAWLP